MKIKPGMRIRIKCLDKYSHPRMKLEIGQRANVVEPFAPHYYPDVFTVRFNNGATSQYRASSLISDITNTKLGKILYR